MFEPPCRVHVDRVAHTDPGERDFPSEGHSWRKGRPHRTPRLDAHQESPAELSRRRRDRGPERSIHPLSQWPESVAKYRARTPPPPS